MQRLLRLFLEVRDEEGATGDDYDADELHLTNLDVLSEDFSQQLEKWDQRHKGQSSCGRPAVHDRGYNHHTQGECNSSNGDLDVLVIESIDIVDTLRAGWHPSVEVLEADDCTKYDRIGYPTPERDHSEAREPVDALVICQTLHNHDDSSKAEGAHT